MVAPIKVSAQVYSQLRERLLTAHPDLAEDERCLLDSLEGETDFDEVAVALFESAEMDAGMASVIKARMTELAERATRFQARHETKRALLAEAMIEAGRDKIESPTVTLSLRRNPPGVVVVDEAAIPPDFKAEKVVVSIDRALIKKALNDGFTVPGATLGNGSVSLSARVK